MNIKSVVLAAGNGSRLHPLTLEKPKPLLEVAGKPIIEYSLLLLNKYNIKEVNINSCYLSEKMVEYFNNRPLDELHINLKVETEMLGTAGGVKQFESFLDSTFIVVSGDLITNFNIQEMYDFHKAKKSKLTLGFTKCENPYQYGILDISEDSKIIRFLEKPKKEEEIFSNLINTGIYMIEPEVLKFIPHNTFFDFSRNLFPLLMENNEYIYAYDIKGYWRDLGDLEQLKQGELDILNKNHLSK